MKNKLMGSIDNASTSSSSSSSPISSSLSMGCEEKLRMEESPITVLLWFQKAMRLELERLDLEVISLAASKGGDFKMIKKRFRFLFSIYKHHCNAEDEVIFPALDMRVKNVTQAYSLEHKGERALFNQLFDLLNSGVQNDDSFRRKLASSTGAIRTSLSQHMSKEEIQVFPLLMEKFTFEEQADLVWHFLCGIPVNMMTAFLPWLSSYISPHEHHDMMKCLCKIAPEQNLLQQVISSWMEGMGSKNQDRSCDDLQFQDCVSSGPEKLIDQTEKQVWTCQHSRSGKRKHVESDDTDVGLIEMHPINEILHWHNAIKKELNEILDVAKKGSNSADPLDYTIFHSRLQFIADIYSFHSIAEDQVIFPTLDGEISLVQENSEEETHAYKFRQLIEKILCGGTSSSAAEFQAADQIMDAIQMRFQTEEAEVLPLVRLRLCPEKQRELLYESMCMMPLKLLEHAIPWFVGTLTEEESKSFLQNIQMAAPASDDALVNALSRWALMGRSEEISSSRLVICFSSKSIDGCPLEEKNGTPIDCSKVFCVCPCPFSTKAELALLQTDKDKRPLKRCNFVESCANSNQHISTNTINIQLSCDRQPCCAPEPKITGNNLLIKSIPASKSSTSSPNLSTFLKEANIISSNGKNRLRPIDNIFKFHKALCKDLEYLDVESGKLLGRDEAFLQKFSGRFRLLWSLYEAHSRAEDDIVFPALESREALHNVSYSYTLDHKQEEKLFEDISAVLEEFSKHTVSSDHDFYWKGKHNELATKLQTMCKSLRISLEQHVFSEEMELWPLFDKHFSVEEQNKIVGRVIGLTGAEVLQSMLPWVTSALTLEEKNSVMDTWKQATKNTMFNEWLNEWWKETPISSPQAVTETNHVVPKGIEYLENFSQNDQTFKPGWKDIFRMNQNELESEIRKVYRDPTLDQRRKDYLIQNLMTSRWIAAQQKSSQISTTEGHSDSEDMPGCSATFRDADKQIFGCEHYKRNCKLLAACCNKLFTCRFCHDKVSDHSMDRKATTQMLCMRCLKVQPVGQTCKTLACDGFSMAKFFCSICKLFDDERTIYHCPFCNLCRVGNGLGIDYFHCMGCNFCLGMKLVEHKCREKSLETNCPICCDFLFTSTEPLRAFRCGHFMHSACFQAYTCSHYTCPICSKSLGDMTVYIGMLDALLAAEELPDEYKDRHQDILCNDCDKKGKSRFHWLYHKCAFCGSYNTRVIKSEVK